MSSKKEGFQVFYSYDPIDRHTGVKHSDGTSVRIFHRGDRVATEVADDVVHSVFEAQGALLGQQTANGGGQETTLIAHDDKRSTLLSLRANETEPQATAYSVFGYSPIDKASHRVLGFNGERYDKNSGFYLLGNGYRAFNTVLMRFNSPDNQSPFGDGGINAYAYCTGDPVNRTDPSGHSWMSPFKGIGNLFWRQKSILKPVGDYTAVKLGGGTGKIYGRNSISHKYARLSKNRKFSEKTALELANNIDLDMVARREAHINAKVAGLLTSRRQQALTRKVDTFMSNDPKIAKLRVELENARGVRDVDDIKMHAAVVHEAAEDVRRIHERVNNIRNNVEFEISYSFQWRRSN
ncbi:RHS repeat-associated core domain-containing protein [Pseudomonas sp. R3-41]